MEKALGFVFASGIATSIAATLWGWRWVEIAEPVGWFFAMAGLVGCLFSKNGGNDSLVSFSLGMAGFGLVWMASLSA